MSEMSLENKENYNSDYTTDSYKRMVINILINFNDIIKQYLNRIDEQIKINNLEYFKYIIISGIKTITHVFRVLVFNTKNLKLSYEYSNKAVYYYIEFISQIGYENNTYLNLTPKDAGLFVYKKTIFNIINEYVKQSDQTHEYNELILILTDIIMNRIIKSISNDIFNGEIEILVSRLEKYTNSLKKMMDTKHTSNSNIKDKLKIVNEVEKNIKQKKYVIEFEFIETIIKKLEKECDKNKMKEFIEKQINILTL
jgi:hypothetical protein